MTDERVFIDKQHPQVYRAQREVARVVRQATQDAGLDRALVELVNIRVSQLNRCAYCLNIHVRDAVSRHPVRPQVTADSSDNGRTPYAGEATS